EWESASSVARAFGIGKLESGAVSALMTSIDPSVAEQLTEAVRCRGMAKLLSHEVISRGMFSKSWTSGLAAAESWKEVLRNKEDGRIVQLFVARLLADHDRCPQTMRKALTYKDAVPKHQCCGMFCHLLDCLERNAPATQFKDMQDRLHKMFMESFMDPDLLHMVSSEVPPGDLKTVAAFRPFLAQLETMVREAKEEKEAALAATAREADLNRLLSNLENDFELLRSRVESSGKEAEVLFAKPDSSAKDARALCQTAIACFHTHFSEHAFTSSVAIREGKLGPCNLVKISDFIGYDGELSKPGAAARVEQRGVPCRDTMIAGILDGLTLRDVDTVLMVDVVPNRFAEFGRATVERNLLESAFPVHYFGFLFQEFDATTSAVRSRVYEHWDNSSTSPPKERPREERAAEVACPPLGALAWAGKQPVFPQVLVDRFLEGSAEHAQIMAKKKEFDAMFPAAAQPPPTSVPARAGGLCDASRELHGVVWRVVDDLHFVAYNKKLLPVCQFLRMLAVDHGLGEVEFVDHVLTQRVVKAP
ncbi:unnamed protein product, partial [Durusdinium trenchii]